MVRTFYIRQGKRERDVGFKRGHMVVRTEAEWKERWRDVTSSSKRKVARTVGVIYILLVALIILVWLPSAEEGEGLVTTALLLIAVSLTLWGGFFIIWYHETYGPTMGLYQLGAQADFETLR